MTRDEIMKAAYRALFNVFLVSTQRDGDPYRPSNGTISAFTDVALAQIERAGLKLVPAGHVVIDPAALQARTIAEFIADQRQFSETTFGPGARTAGVLAHILKELGEIEAAPNDLFEWVDVVLLALDGAWRAGHQPDEIAVAMESKLLKNKHRRWPDWRTAGDGPIEHVRGM